MKKIAGLILLSLFGNQEPQSLDFATLEKSGDLKVAEISGGKATLGGDKWGFLSTTGDYGDAVLDYILGTLQPDTQLAQVGYPVTDEFSHQFMGLVTPTDMDGAPNPYFDDVNGDGVKDNRIASREGYIRGAYHEADAKLARNRMGVSR